MRIKSQKQLYFKQSGQENNKNEKNKEDDRNADVSSRV